MAKVDLPNDGEFFNLVSFVREQNEPRKEEEPYKTPYRIQFFKNKIAVYQRQMDDLVEERRMAIKELKKFQDKMLTAHKQLQEGLNNVNERLRQVEGQIKETYCLLKKEMMHL